MTAKLYFSTLVARRQKVTCILCWDQAP